ncbi:MAG: hypothetical protein WAT79_09805 [Saprospiraceae bacterium]
MGILNNIFFTFCIIVVVNPIHGQQTTTKPLTISVFTVATQLPGGKLLPIHPGLEIGTEFKLNKSHKRQWFQTAKFGVFHHRLSQTAIMIYSENGFRPSIYKGLSADIKIGMGYLHSIPDLQTFSLREGSYEKKSNLGRPQFKVSFAFGLGWSLGKETTSPRIFAVMQSIFQMPFIKSYVPLLPNTAIHLGVSFPFFNLKKD